MTEATVVRAAAGDGEAMVTLRLVPVEIFGSGLCDEANVQPGGCCDAHAGYGISDAVAAWSDCNRARGRIYRIDDPGFHREPGESVEIMVKRRDLPFFEKRWGDDFDDGPAREHVRVVKVEAPRD